MSARVATEAAAKVPRVAAAHNGRAISCDVDSTAFLLARPRGAYTAARTVNRTRVFDYEGHLKRLADSTVAMQNAPFASAAVEAVLRPRVESTLRAAMTSFQELFGSDDEEYKLTVLICAEQAEDATTESAASTPEELLASSDVFAHVALLPPLRTGLVKLQVAGLPRANAVAKDSDWVKQRKAIYATMASDVEEIILMDPADHRLLEGSQTNFYAIQQGTLYTAEDKILKGTVRALVLDGCRALGIPVVLSPPVLDSVDEWDACFISSTSRLALGASCLEYEDLKTKEHKVRTFPSSDAMEKIMAYVRSSVEQKSTQVF